MSKKNFQKELIKKIIKKKEFSQLPIEDVNLALAKFSSEKYLDEERVKLTRDLLRKIYSGFVSPKLLSVKDKGYAWTLRKHLSTRERLMHYNEVYSRVLEGVSEKNSIIDLGAGINGFSYSFFKDLGYDVSYTAVEAVKQLVDLMNYYFGNNNLDAKAIFSSLFNLEEIKKVILKEKEPRVVFLFKVIDCLEMLEKDYSKKLLLEIVPLVERVVISFATKSMGGKKKFYVKRDWVLNFIEEYFEILDDFEEGGERYIVIGNRK